MKLTCLKNIIKNNKLTLLLAVGAVTGFFNGCSTSGVLLDHDDQKNRSIAYARAAEPFAMMSALAYATNGTDKNDLAQRKDLAAHLEASGWHQDCTGRFSPTANAKNVGLHYDVWINEVQHPAIIVIAARGTELKDWRDWWSNAWWLTRWLSNSNQYRVIALPTEAGRVFSTYEKEIASNKVVVITTGHSLGGGIAQCLRYAYQKQVSQCYAFDPSPVTGYMDNHGRSKAEGVQNRKSYMESMPILGFPAHRTLRIYEKGEILASFRGFMRGLYAVDDKILEVRFKFDPHFKPVAQHSMMLLAEKIFNSANPTNQMAQPDLNQLNQYHPWWKSSADASK